MFKKFALPVPCFVVFICLLINSATLPSPSYVKSQIEAQTPVSKVVSQQVWYDTVKELRTHGVNISFHFPEIETYYYDATVADYNKIKNFINYLNNNGENNE